MPLIIIYILAFFTISSACQPFQPFSFSLFSSSEREFGKKKKMEYIKSWHIFALRLCSITWIFDWVKMNLRLEMKGKPVWPFLENLLSLSCTPDFTFTQLSFGSLQHQRLQLRQSYRVILKVRQHKHCNKIVPFDIVCCRGRVSYIGWRGLRKKPFIWLMSQ